jgi:hypothetical protein
VLSLRPGRLILDIQKFLDDVPLTGEIPQMDNKLARMIKAKTNGPELSEHSILDGTVQKGLLQRFCEEHGPEVEYINSSFSNGESDLLDLIYILQNNLCPKLRYLGGDFHNIPEKCPTILPTMAKLECIDIQLSSNTDKV